MNNQYHSQLSGNSLHSPGYYQPYDPGNIGANKMWFDSSSMTLKFRNLTNSDWEVVRGAFVTAMDPGAVGAGRLWVDIAFGTGGYILRCRNNGNTGWETLSGGQVPIGTALMWHKTLMASVGVSSLPWGYVECNGQVLADSDSVLNGLTIPNLNVGNGLGRFVRGTTGDSGVTQSNQNKSHTHSDGTLAAAAHTHSDGTLAAVAHTHSSLIHFTDPNNGGTGQDSTHWNVRDGKTGSTGPLDVTGNTGSTGPVDVSGLTGSEGGSEARPETMTMTFIMRVK